MLERNAMPAPGARFFRGDDGRPMFEFVIDSSNVIGPRIATQADQDKHVGAWRLFADAEGAAGPLDRNASGTPGGSLPATPEAAAALAAEPDPAPAEPASEAPKPVDEEADLLEAMTEDELRDFIKRKTGRLPHSSTSPEKLLVRAREAAAQA